jgi:hypothetical protein
MMVPTMPHNVNLDALIFREDFEVTTTTLSQQVDEAPKIKIVELEAISFFFKVLRKPEFQRTTSHWPPEKVAGFIKSFLSGDLIPALILWRSQTSGKVFVIDGAHRLSALIAWVHDDYGDGLASKAFCENNIPAEQTRTAAETRVLVNNAVGAYADLKHGANVSTERQLYASNLGAGGATLQWVKGDASRAERSFHTINTEQTPISNVEVRLIRDRRCANVMATRSLIGAGTGQYFASSFSEENKQAVRKLAKSIYDDLFVPSLETPIKTLDLPVAGRSYSFETVSLILDVIEYVNKSSKADKQEKKQRSKGNSDILAPTMEKDVDGSQTLKFLQNLRHTSSRIAGTQSESLGLHPAVYFYSATGNYQPTAFLATVSLVQRLVASDKVNEFCQARFKFEELLLKYKYFINQIGRKYGAGTRGLTALSRLYDYMVDGVIAGKSEVEIVPQLHEDAQLAFLAPIVDFDKGVKKEFSSERKSAIFLKTALDNAIGCGICKARMHRNSITIDHVLEQRVGGVGSVGNGQLAHPYCNGAFKDWLQNSGNQLIV